MVDLFAGSGALGIEALSRGAAHCTFVEPARPALDAIREPIWRATGFAERATVVATAPGRTSLAGGGAVDLALVDPPYAFDEWAELLAAGTGRARGVRVGPAIDLAPAWRAPGRGTMAVPW